MFIRFFIRFFLHLIRINNALIQITKSAVDKTPQTFRGCEFYRSFSAAVLLIPKRKAHRPSKENISPG